MSHNKRLGLLDFIDRMSDELKSSMLYAFIVTLRLFFSVVR